MKTKWHVITGAPSSGKSLLISYLASHGYYTFPDIARTLIEVAISEGKTAADVRANEMQFQNQVFNSKYQLEQKLDPETTIFLDYGLQDTVAFFEHLGLDTTDVTAKCHSNYATVFMLEQLPLARDNVRLESESDLKNLRKIIEKSYLKFGYSLIKVPVGTVEERAKFVLSNLN